MKKLEPSILKGTRDFLPAEMARRNYAMARIREIFERFGYAPIETPILSPAETILGKYGEEGDRLTYHFKDAGDREVALPYDLTVPFARYVAAHWSELPIPFKRYQIQRVWRAEKPQKGRLREFYQCDIDAVGTKSLVLEAEVARVIVEVFTTLGIRNFKIKFNSRRLMNSVLAARGVGEAAAVIRTIDKLDKIGVDEVVRELSELGIPDAPALMGLLAREGDTASTLRKFQDFDTAEIAEFVTYAEALGVAPAYLEFDPSLARGLDYYTGIIFEVVSSDSDFGTICAGGRYDDLTGLFEVNAPKSATPELSGMGVAFGFERIMLLLEEQGLLNDVQLSSDVLVTVFDGATFPEAIKLYRALIDAGVRAEIYFEPAKLEKQLKFADKKGIPYAVVLGPEEKSKGVVLLKDMRSGVQEALSIEELGKRFGRPR